jgi:OOP family OmpA-OmpF porin
MVNLIELASGYLTPDVLSKASSLVGENPAGTQKALEAIIPSLVGAASQQASTPSGASSLLRLLTSSNIDSGILTNFAGALSGGSTTSSLMQTGSGLLSGLLGNKQDGVARLIAGAAGVQHSSATSLLQLAAPLVMGLIGKHVISQGLTAASLGSFFGGQKDMVLRHAPAGLASVLGVNSMAHLFGTEQVAPLAVAVEKEEKKGIPIWLWLLPLLLLGAFFAYRNCGTPTVKLPTMSTLALPCGTSLSAEEGGFAWSLASWMLKGTDSDLPKNFVFDHLNFDTASHKLTPESQPTVDNLIAILKCWPTMQVRLEGHTDNTGDAAANKQLSLDRANEVRDLLVTGGIDASRITTDGFGQDKPIASNDTDEGKAKNRRTELTVVKR